MDILSTASSFVTKNKTKIMPDLVQPAKIGDTLECDVVLARTTEFEAEVTEYPVEDGFSISDHCIRKPLKLSMDILFTPTPVTWWNAYMGGSRHTLNRVIDAVMDIWNKGEPVTITLVDAIYDDMVLISAPMPRRAEDGYCYKATLQFQHVRRVTQRTEDIPEDGTNTDAKGKAGGTDKEGGSASTAEIGTGMKTVDPSENAGKGQVPGIVSSNIDLSQFGSVGVGLEATGYMAASSISESLGGAILW